MNTPLLCRHVEACKALGIWARRSSVLVVFVLCCASAYGQSDCPFADSVAVADTLDPSDYFPLKVGNVWDYVVRNDASLDNPRREEIVADTLIDGTTFFKRRLTFFQYENSQVITRSTTFLDFIAVVDSGVVQWTNRSQGFEEFRFNYPFNSCYEIVDGDGMVIVAGGYRIPFAVEENGEEVIVELPATKGFGTTHFFEEYGHGIGRIRRVGDPSLGAELTYFRVNGLERGTPLDSLFTIVVSAEEKSSIPRQQPRLQNYPNPFKATTYISFSLMRPGRVSLHIVDMLGRGIAQPLVEAPLTAGEHVIPWNARGLASGVYWVRLVTNDGRVAHTRMVHVN